MLRSQKTMLTLSEKRQKQTELAEAVNASASGATEEQVKERTALAEYRTQLEEEGKETRAAGDFGDAEARERRALVAGSNVGAVFAAAVEHRQTDGQVAELQQALKLAANQIPLELLETRAVTPAPGEVEANQAAIEPYVFPNSVAEFLAIPRPTVGVGEAIYPTLTGMTDVHAPAKNGAAAETTGAFEAQKLSPARLQASFFYAREDAASFVGMGESLRSNLSEALSDGLDRQILVGANGLLTGANLAHVAAAAVTTYAGYRQKLAYDHVDGRFASSPGDLRVVVGSATYAHVANVYGTDIGLPSALEGLTTPSVLGGLRVSAHVPAVAASKQFAVVRRGTRRDAVAPVWQGVTIIPDEITLSAKGQIKITAVMLHAVKILRAAGFAKVQVQHA